jgi:hypothetical protein
MRAAVGYGIHKGNRLYRLVRMMKWGINHDLVIRCTRSCFARNESVNIDFRILFKLIKICFTPRANISIHLYVYMFVNVYTYRQCPKNNTIFAGICACINVYTTSTSFNTDYTLYTVNVYTQYNTEVILLKQYFTLYANYATWIS